MYVLAPESDSVAGLAGVRAFLPCLQPRDAVLTADEAREVLEFFFPTKPLDALGPPRVDDRLFAQALLLEAIDASLAMSWIERLFKSFYLKLPRSGRDVLRKVVKWALGAARFRRQHGDIRFEDVRIYANVRATLARNFASTLTLRLQTGEYPPYCGD